MLLIFMIKCFTIKIIGQRSEHFLGYLWYNKKYDKLLIININHLKSAKIIIVN